MGSIILNNASPLVNNIIWPVSNHCTNQRTLTVQLVQIHRKNVLNTCLNICLGTHIQSMCISSLINSYRKTSNTVLYIESNCYSSIDNCNILQTEVENHALKKTYTPFRSFWQLTSVLFFIVVLPAFGRKLLINL